jgi:hypothetical protein
MVGSCSLKQVANSKTDVKIAGNWDIQSISSSEKPDSALLKDFNNMLHTLLINANIEFYADHKFTAQVAGKNYSGTWETDAKVHKVKLTEARKESTYSVEFKNDNEIVLKGNEGKQEFEIKLVRQGLREK